MNSDPWAELIADVDEVNQLIPDEYFTEGQCHALAWSLHLQTDWPILVMSDFADLTEGATCHAVVEMPDGRWLDIRGPQEAGPYHDEWIERYDLRYVHGVAGLSDFTDWQLMDPDPADWWAQEILLHFDLTPAPRPWATAWAPARDRVMVTT